MTASSAPPLLAGDPARRRKERVVARSLALAATVSVAISVSIVLALVFEAAEFLGKIDLSDLFTIGWFPRRGMFDVLTVILGSLVITVVAMCIAAPIGLLAAIHLSEYASPGSGRWSSPCSRSSRASRAWCSASSPSRSSTPGGAAPVQRRARVRHAGRRHRRRDPHHPARRVGLRRRAPRGAPEPARSLLRAGRAETNDQRAGRGPGRYLGHRGRVIIGISRAIGETMVVAIAAVAPAARCARWTRCPQVRPSPRPSHRSPRAPT